MPGSNPLLFKPKLSWRYSGIALLLIHAIACLALLLGINTFRSRIDEIRAADSDNRGWLVAQLDVDYKALIITAESVLLVPTYPDVAGDSADLKYLKLQFDIFFSRVQTIIESLSRETIAPKLTEQLNTLKKMRDNLASQIDIIETEDLDVIAQFTINIRDIGPLVRNVTTQALQLHVQKAESARVEERQLLARFSLQSLFLLVLMVLSTFLALRIWRELESRTMKMRRALGSVAKAFDAPLGAVVIADINGTIRMANLASSRIFGVSAEQMVGRSIAEVMIPPRHRTAHQEGMEKYQLSGDKKMIDAGPCRVTATRFNGEEFPAEISISADNDVDGRPILIGFVRDLSEKVVAEEKLLAALEEAEQHASAKTMFLATMSHEMRTPLHGLLASLELLDPSPLTEESRQLLKTACDCGQRALQQVNDVLEITRLGQNKEGKVAFNPTNVVSDIVAELTPMAKKRGTSIKVHTAGDGAETRLYLGLALAFSRAIYNLVGNAVKFTENGEVLITLRFDVITREGANLYVEVKDNGVGIAIEDQDRIFGEFETTSPSDLTANGGTGLGLPIVRLAVQRMGGELRLESAPKQGSKFSFGIRLPFASETVNPLTAHADEAFTKSPTDAPLKLNILVVDDIDVNVNLLAKMVRRAGHMASVAKNGLEAVAMASMDQYDVILMDVSMPIMNGCEATAHIRSGCISSTARIIGVTAYSDQERINKLCKIGMNMVLTKPISQKDLTDMLNTTAGDKVICYDELPDCVRDRNLTDFKNALNALSELIGADSAMKFFRETLQELSNLIGLLGDDPPVGDDVADKIHRTAGTTTMIGLSGLSTLLLRAEEAARANDQATLCRLLPRIQKSFSEIGSDVSVL
jgi:PAS domain S-box-containing protein